MHKSVSAAWIGLLLLLFVIAVGKTTAEEPRIEASKTAEPKLTAKGVEFFEAKIRPVLSQRCYSCHSATAKEVKGDLLLDTREGTRQGGESGAAVVPGDVEDSLLIQAIRHETYEMPPGDKLPDSVIADFEKWIEMGAPDPRSKSDAAKKLTLAQARKHWSFQQVKKPSVPQAMSNWPTTNIDRFIHAKLSEKQLEPVSDADRRTLLRRLSFDLIGLPPTPEEIADFLNDKSPDAYEKQVDRLLKSPHFGERWGRHWLDVARYGESTGKERNIPYPYAWRYRDYVIESFKNDKPYNRFLLEQVAGDLLPAKNNEEYNTNLIATGFLAIGTKSLNERRPAQYKADVADEQIDVVTRAVLGITVACARCHDHKFDPIPQTDYYALAGVFKSTEVFDGVQPGNNMKGYQGEYAYLVSPDTPRTPKHTPEELEKIKELQAKLVEIRQNLVYADARAQFKGKRAERAEMVSERLQQLLKRTTQELEELKDNKKIPKGDQPVMAVRDVREPRDAAVNERGEVNKLGPIVPRGIPIVLAVGRPPRFETEQSGRLQLAHWLASKENPLTARVMANRIWAHLMGRGVVESTDNFGALGDEPTHPELLDYLAVRLVEEGWSVKQLIREIVLSRTYRLSSTHDAENFAIDGDNRYLWRMSRRRLEAEAIRDGMLAASGRLNLTPPAGSPVQKLAEREVGRGRMGMQPRDDGTHRSVYLPLVRGAVPESLSVFDVADPSLPVAQREVTTVATQALFLMNSPFVIENCQALAKKLLADSSASDRRRIERLFELSLARLPTSEEVNSAQEYLRRYDSLVSDKISNTDDRRTAAWASLVQTVFATGEFRYVY